MTSATENKGEVAMDVKGLLPKLSSLFNNRVFSDVEFVFMGDPGDIQKIYCHKLILALRSEVFASMFFGVKESLYEVRLPASKQPSFTHLLRFLYTDDVQFHAFEEAQELFELANEYAVKELIEKCSNYILHETLTIENVFPKYECAIRKNMHLLLKDCQDFVCCKAELVLESVYFKNASEKVVEDIVKLDNLSVSSELDIIGAVLKWGSEEMKRNKISPDEKYLRKSIDPFMKHLRFLTLSSSEFDYFIENFNIFTGYESSILTRKIFQSHCVVDFPESLCPITTKRAKKQDSKTMPTVAAEENTFLSSFPKSTSPDSPFMKVSSVSVADSTSHDLPSKISPPISKPKIFTDLKLPTASSNKISYQIKTHSSVYETSVSQSHLKQTKFISSPNLMDRNYFPIVLHNSHYREYEFELQESKSCLETSFPKDVKSSVSFKMITGRIALCGLELKVKKNNRTVEEFEIDVDLIGFSRQPISHQFKKKLEDNILTLMFPEKVVLQEGSKGVLDVSVDNLCLDRCDICDINNKGYKLNIGLGFACEISLGSTRKAGNYYIFLISKLMYLPY